VYVYTAIGVCHIGYSNFPDYRFVNTLTWNRNVSKSADGYLKQIPKTKWPRDKLLEQK